MTSYNTNEAYDVVLHAPMTLYTYDVVRGARTTSYGDVARHARTTT